MFTELVLFQIASRFKSKGCEFGTNKTWKKLGGPHPSPPRDRDENLRSSLWACVCCCATENSCFPNQKIYIYNVNTRGACCTRVLPTRFHFGYYLLRVVRLEALPHSGTHHHTALLNRAPRRGGDLQTGVCV